MPVFSTRPELPGGISPGQGVGLLSDHLCRMQEELEYRLSVLDSGNILSLDLEQTPIRTPQGDLQTVLRDGDGKVSALTQSVEGFRTQVSDYEQTVDGYSQQVSQFQQTAEGFQTQVSDYEQAVEGYAAQVSDFQQTAEGFQTQVSDYEQAVEGYAAQVSDFQQTAEGFQTRVSDYEQAVEGYAAQVSTFQQTAEGFRTQVTGYEQAVEGYTAQVSTFQQTAADLTASVTDLEDGMSATLTLNKNGLIVSNGSGDSVSISGSQIEAGSITADKIESIEVTATEIMGDEVAIKDGGGSAVGGLSTYRNGLSLVSNGELGLAAYGGQLYVEGPGETTLTVDQYGPYDEYSFLFNADLLPDPAVNCYLGRSGWAWAGAYLESAPVVASDRSKKQEICYDLGRYDGLFDRLAPAAYRLKAHPEQGRHLGFIAQDVQEALAHCGLEPEAFAGLEAGPRGLSLRYDCFIPLLVQQVQSLKKRVEELEAQR